MTYGKDLKRLIRARMAKTGESYTAARRFFLGAEEHIMSAHSFETTTNNEFGFRLDIPEDWESTGSHFKNSAYEVGRYVRNIRDVYDGNLIVIWSPTTSYDTKRAAENNVADLKSKGWEGFTTRDEEIDGRPGIHLDSHLMMDRSGQNGPKVDQWNVSTHFVYARTVMVALSFGSMSTHDEAFIEHVIASFHVIEHGIGIVFQNDDATPMEFVVDTLQQVFDYPRDDAIQKTLRIHSQGESVVALVEHGRADTIVSTVQARASASGYPLQCRVAAVGF